VDDPRNAPAPPPTTAFLLELVGGQSRLYAAISALLGGDPAAHDVLQETNLVLLRKAAEYDPARPFLPWALGFARFEVMAWRKRQSRDRLLLDDDVVAALADQLAEDPPARGDAADRLDALERCRRRLPDETRRLLDLRYREGESVRAIAARLGRTENVVSVTLFRIRQALLRCMGGRPDPAAEAG
jgi:RNA polymerase sigma-70 factor (ECF subfamily)